MSLALPTIPDNLRLQDGLGKLVESDMFNICERVKEIDPNLFIYELPDGGSRTIDGRTVRYSISELCADGVMRLVYRAGELDGRVIENLQRMLRVPFADRFAEAEALETAAEADRKANELDDLAERIGLPMHQQLAHDGFITHRGASVAKRGVLLGRNRAR